MSTHASRRCLHYLELSAEKTSQLAEQGVAVPRNSRLTFCCVWRDTAEVCQATGCDRSCVFYQPAASAPHHPIDYPTAHELTAAYRALLPVALFGPSRRRGHKKKETRHASALA